MQRALHRARHNWCATTGGQGTNARTAGESASHALGKHVVARQGPIDREAKCVRHVERERATATRYQEIYWNDGPSSRAAAKSVEG